MPTNKYKYVEQQKAWRREHMTTVSCQVRKDSNIFRALEYATLNTSRGAYVKRALVNQLVKDGYLSKLTDDDDEYLTDG